MPPAENFSLVPPPEPKALSFTIQTSSFLVLATNSMLVLMALMGGWVGASLCVATIIGRYLAANAIHAVLWPRRKKVKSVLVDKPGLILSYERAAKRIFGQTKPLYSYDMEAIMGRAKDKNKIFLSQGVMNKLTEQSQVAVALHEHAHLMIPLYDRKNSQDALTYLQRSAPTLIAGLGVAGLSPPMSLGIGLTALGLSYGLTVMFNRYNRREELLCDRASAYGIETAVPMLQVLKHFHIEDRRWKKQYPVKTFLYSHLPFCATHPGIIQRRLALHAIQKELKQKGIRPTRPESRDVVPSPAG